MNLEQAKSLGFQPVALTTDSPIPGEFFRVDRDKRCVDFWHPAYPHVLRHVAPAGRAGTIESWSAVAS